MSPIRQFELRGRAARWCLVYALLCLPLLMHGQEHQPTPAPRIRQRPIEDPAEIERGRALFKASCGFCHGDDATGARGPDLIRSAVLSHDDNGNLLGPIIRNGRIDKEMPGFTTMKDDQLADIVAFLHHQAKVALASAHVPGDYPLAKLLTGNVEQGKLFFEGGGGCAQCHSVTGDLAGVAKKYSPIDLQQRMIYPSAGNILKNAVVTLKDGTRCEGKLKHEDEFDVGVICQNGWYRSWARKDVQVEVHDPLEAHRNLVPRLTDADIHNLLAYLESLKSP